MSLGFDPWVRKLLWGREWLPTPVSLSRELHGQRSLVGYSPWVCKSWTWLRDWITTNDYRLPRPPEGVSWRWGRDEENVPVHCWYSDSAQDVLGGMWRLYWNRTGSWRVQGGVSRADRWSGMGMLGSGGSFSLFHTPQLLQVKPFVTVRSMTHLSKVHARICSFSKCLLNACWSRKDNNMYCVLQTCQVECWKLCLHPLLHLILMMYCEVHCYFAGEEIETQRRSLRLYVWGYTASKWKLDFNTHHLTPRAPHI